MNDSFEEPPKKEVSPDQKAKQHLEELSKRIEEEGGDKKMLAKWDSLSEKIDAGDRAKVLTFLETLKLRKETNVDSWRKAILNLSKPELSLASEEELGNFMSKEFSHRSIIYNEKIDQTSLNGKIEIIEEEIRNLYKQRDQLKEEITKKVEELKKKKLTEVDRRELQKDRELLSKVPASLYIYRKVRNSLYQKKYHPGEKVTKDPSS